MDDLTYILYTTGWHFFSEGAMETLITVRKFLFAGLEFFQIIIKAVSVNLIIPWNKLRKN